MTEMGSSHERTGIREFKRFLLGYIDLKYSIEAKNMYKKDGVQGY